MTTGGPSERSLEILLVEDQERHRKVYETALADALPVRVRSVGDGLSALAAVTGETPPDLVLLDLDIPGLPGNEVLARIKATPRLRHIPVIILTGQSDPETQLALLDQGADDFIEKGGTPSVLIARLKAQLRHKLALDRLERLALDRDLFAAGVLQDIGTTKWTIVSLCRQAKAGLDDDPVARQPQILEALDKLSAHASRLGAYAADVIQSVRETHRTPVLATQDLQALIAWVTDVLAVGPEGATTPLAWRVEPRDATLAPVLADKSFLRLALLQIVQQALRSARDGVPLELTVAQVEHDDPEDPRGRRFVTTRIEDNGRGLEGRDPSSLFLPYGGADSAGASLGLALVAKVVARMGGQVWAEASAQGSGTVLCLDLPKA